VDLGIWSKLTRLTLWLLAAAGVLAAGLAVAHWYLPVIKQNERMRKEILRFDTQIQKEEDTERRLKAETQAISNDPKVLERLIRERLGYAKTGETIIRFEPRTSNAALPR
jgi:cell division protein FtsB